MKRIFRNISLIMCTITLTFVGCENKLETVNNDSNNNETESEVISGSINGHDYIDLGLPSGTKWATCNVGGSKPGDSGDAFVWGETEPAESGQDIYLTIDSQIQLFVENGIKDISKDK